MSKIFSGFPKSKQSLQLKFSPDPQVVTKVPELSTLQKQVKNMLIEEHEEKQETKHEEEQLEPYTITCFACGKLIIPSLKRERQIFMIGGGAKLDKICAACYDKAIDAIITKKLEKVEEKKEEPILIEKN